MRSEEEIAANALHSFAAFTPAAGRAVRQVERLVDTCGWTLGLLFLDKTLLWRSMSPNPDDGEPEVGWRVTLSKDGVVLRVVCEDLVDALREAATLAERHDSKEAKRR